MPRAEPERADELELCSASSTAGLDHLVGDVDLHVRLTGPQDERQAARRVRDPSG